MTVVDRNVNLKQYSSHKKNKSFVNCNVKTNTLGVDNNKREFLL